MCSSRSTLPPIRPHRWWPWLLITVGIAVYANSLGGPFIYDDHAAIGDNWHLHGMWPPHRLLTAPDESPAAGRPVVCLSLALNYAFGGTDVIGYRLFNVAVHVLVSLLLYAVVRRSLLGPRLGHRWTAAADGIAGTTALIWLVHPVASECVDYVTQRSESIMALFYLLTLYCAAWASSAQRSTRWWLAAILACALGMASKEVMVTAPLLILLHGWIYMGPMAPMGPSGPMGSMGPVRRHWRWYLGLACTWLLLAYLMVGKPRGDTIGFGHGISATGYALNQVVAVVNYLRMIVWPHPLVLDYGFPQPLVISDVAIPLVLLIGLLLLTLALCWRCPPAGYPCLWFFVILAPTSTLVPIISEVAAERRMYLAMAGPVAGVVVLAHLLRQAMSRSNGFLAHVAKVPAWIVVAAVAAVLGARTISRNHQYRDPVVLWQSVIEAAPENPRAYNNLGHALHLQRRLQEAMAQYRRALALRPEYAGAHYNLGHAMQELGQLDQAEHHYRQAQLHKPYDPKPYNNLATVLLARGLEDEALGQLQKAVQADGTYADAHQNIGMLRLRRGQPAEASRSLRLALALGRDGEDVHFHLATALAMDGRPEDAERHYRAAIVRDGKSARSHHHLGMLLTTLGRSGEAINHYRQALALNASPTVHRHLADVLQQHGHTDEARSHYEAALQMDPVDEPDRRAPEKFGGAKTSPRHRTR